MDNFDKALLTIETPEHIIRVASLIKDLIKEFNLDENKSFSATGALIDQQLRRFLLINREFSPENFTCAVNNFRTTIKEIEDGFNPN